MTVDGYWLHLLNGLAVWRLLKHMVTPPGGTTLAGALRSGLDLLATILVVAVAGALLVRILAAPPPARAERVAPSPAAGARPEPPLPTQPISLDGAAVIGSSTAPVGNV